MTQVAACEALHALIVYMVAARSQDPNRKQEGKQEKLYRRIFPVIIRLATDVEAVSRPFSAVPPYALG
jgi:hypothetical protein